MPIKFKVKTTFEKQAVGHVDNSLGSIHPNIYHHLVPCTGYLAFRIFNAYTMQRATNAVKIASSPLRKRIVVYFKGNDLRMFSALL